MSKYAHVQYVGEEDKEGACTDITQILGFNEERLDEEYWVYWSVKKGLETRQKAMKKLADIPFFQPGQGGGPEDYGYYKAHVIVVGESENDVVQKLKEKAMRSLLHRRRINSAGSSISSSSKRSSVLSSKGSSSSSSKGSTVAPRDNSPGPFDDEDYQVLSSRSGRNEEDSKLSKLKGKLADAKKRISDLEHRLDQITALNIEYQEREIEREKNCNHVCACGQSARLLVTQRTQVENIVPSASTSRVSKTIQRTQSENMAPTASTTTVSQVGEGQEKENPTAHLQNNGTPNQVFFEVHEGLKFPDGTNGQYLVEVADVGDTEAEVNDNGAGDDEMVALYKELKIRKKYHKRIDTWLSTFKSTYGKPGDSPFVGHIAQLVCGEQVLATHTVTGKMSIVFKSDTSKVPKLGPADPPLEKSMVETISTVFRMRLMQEFEAEVPPGETRSKLSFEERLKFLNKYIGDRRTTILRRLKKAA